MAESTHPTRGHDQVNVYTFPVCAHGASWTTLASIAAMFTQAQVDRCTQAGTGAFDLSLRKRHELGRATATEEVASSSVDKPATIERREDGSIRFWNNLAGKEYDSVADITQADFDATSSEVCMIIHHLDEALANVVESEILWRLVVDTATPCSIPNSQDDDVTQSVRFTGDEYIMTANAAGKAVVELVTAIGSVVTVEAAYAGAVERDDWDDDDDGTATYTVLTADPEVGATTVTVQDTTGFAAGQDVMIWTTADSYETNKISSVNEGASQITFQDGLDIDHGIGTVVKRTRGLFFFVRNADSNAYLVAGDDYRVVKTDASTLTVVNVDGGSDIGATDDIWLAWAVASGSELWTDNDTDLYGITHPQCKFVVAPDAAFTTTTTGYTDTENIEDTDLDFESSGSDADTEWYAREFTAAASGKVASVTLNLKKTGSPAGEIYACIYSDDGGGTSVPLAQIGNPSVPVAASTLATGGGDITFQFTDGPDIVDSTIYWVVLKTGGYAYTDTTTEIIWYVDVDGTTAGDEVAKGDPDAGTVWTIVNTNHGADLTVNLVGSQEVKRLQGMDTSVTFTRSAYYEMGSTQTVERSFDETDVRITLPKLASDITTWARLIAKNASTSRTSRPEQSPEVYCRVEVYETRQRLAADIKICYEFPGVKRSGGEGTAPADERMTQRITMQGDEFTIATAL